MLGILRSVVRAQERAQSLRGLHPARATQIVAVRVSDDHKWKHVGVLDLLCQLYHLLFWVIAISRERHKALSQQRADVRAGYESLDEAPALSSQLASELDEDLFAPLRGCSEGFSPARVPMKSALIIEVGMGVSFAHVSRLRSCRPRIGYLS